MLAKHLQTKKRLQDYQNKRLIDLYLELKGSGDPGKSLGPVVVVSR